MAKATRKSRPKPVSRMDQLDKVKADIEKLRRKFDAGEITREQFIEMRKPLGERFRQLY